MSELLENISKIDNSESVKKDYIIEQILGHIATSNFNLHSMDDQRPWGAFFRLNNNDAEQFVHDFFPDLTIDEAKLGRDDVELSPKFLLVEPNQRLSLQYHNRRAEIWLFLTEGVISRSLSDDTEELVPVNAGDIIKIENQERHRLIGCATMYTIVAEIWQHIDSESPSDEDDIVRLQDDYNRSL